MWAADAKLRIDTHLMSGANILTNDQLIKLIQKNRTDCNEFDKALNWLGRRNADQALNECENSTWVNWLKNQFHELHETITKGTKVTITKGKECKYAIWYKGIWDTPSEYIDESSIKIFSND